MLWLVATTSASRSAAPGGSACCRSAWCCCRARCWPGRAVGGPEGRGLPAPRRRLRGARPGCAVRAAGRRAGRASRPVVAAPVALPGGCPSFLLALVAGGLGAARALAPWWHLAICCRPGRGRSSSACSARPPSSPGRARCWPARRSRSTCPTSGPRTSRSRPASSARCCCCSSKSPMCRTPSSGRSATPSVRVSRSERTPWLLRPARLWTGAAPDAGRTAVGAPWRSASVSVAVLSVPYLAGAFGGLLTARAAPTPAVELAPLWGFGCGRSRRRDRPAGRVRRWPAGQRPADRGRPVRVPVSVWLAILEIGAHRRAGRRRRQLAHPPPRFPPQGGRRGQGAEGAEGAWGDGLPPRRGGFRGVASPGQQGPALVDETDDADGHRIYLNPWAAEDRDDW